MSAQFAAFLERYGIQQVDGAVIIRCGEEPAIRRPDKTLGRAITPHLQESIAF